MNEKLKKGLALGAAVIIGGAGVGVYDNAQPIDNAELNATLEALEQVTVNYEELVIEFNGIVLDKEALELELEGYEDVIAEVEAELGAEDLAKEEILEETRDLEDYLEDTFGWDIGDDDDLKLSFLGDVEVSESDFEDEEYTFVFEHVKVTYDEDDEDYVEYLDIEVKVKEGEVDEITYMEA